MSEENYDEYVVRIYKKQSMKQKSQRSEYHAFLTDLYHREIERKLSTKSARSALAEWDTHYPSHLRAMQTLRTLELYLDSGPFTRNAEDTPEQELAWIGRQLGKSIQISNRLLIQSEILGIILDNFDLIIDSMTAEDFPEEDFESLRLAGSEEPYREISALIHTMRVRQEHLREVMSSVTRRGYIDRLLNDLDHLDLHGDLASQAPRRDTKSPGRWWKILGNLGAGTLYTGSDASKLVTVHANPASPLGLAFTPGADIPGGVQSLAAGVGALGSGISDWLTTRLGGKQTR